MRPTGDGRSDNLHAHMHIVVNWGVRDAWSSAPQLTDLLVVDLHSSLANFMMTPIPIAGKLPTENLGCWQLPINKHTHTHTHTHTHIQYTQPANYQ